MKAIFLANLKPSILDSGEEAWIEFAKTGTWKGYGAGEAFSLTETTFDQMISNFDSEQNPRPVYIGHPDAQGIEAPAVGWIRQLKREGKSLFGLVEFLSEAAEQIRNGAYRFVSIYADIAGAVSRETGKEIGAHLKSLGITNQPFIDGLAPIALSENLSAQSQFAIYLGETHEESKDVSKMKTLEDPEIQEAPEQEVKDDMESMLSILREAAGNPELTVEAAMALLREQMDGLKALFSATETEEDAPTQAEAKAASAFAIKELREKNAKLESQIKAFQEKELDALVSEKIAAGVIDSSKKDHYKRLALTDRALFDAITDGAKKNVTLSRVTRRAGANDNSNTEIAFDAIPNSYLYKRGS